MPVAWTIDSRGFTLLSRDLQQQLAGHGLHLEAHDVILSETSSVLQTCLTKTKSLTKTGIDRVAARFVARANTYAGNGRAGQGIRQIPNARGVYPRLNIAAEHHWWIDKNEGGRTTFYIMKGGSPNRLWSDERWAAYQAMLADQENFVKTLLAQLPKIRASRGVTKKSWVQIADDLGITLPRVPGYVRSSVPRPGPRIDGLGRKVSGTHQFFVELENRNQILIGRLGGAGILQRAVSGRIKYFETNMAKGVFHDIARITKRYPGMVRLATTQLAAAA